VTQKTFVGETCEQTAFAGKFIESESSADHWPKLSLAMVFVP
jgi:hypothetical protein